MKTYFFQRIGAYIIDIIIVVLIASLIYTPFQSSNVEKLYDEIEDNTLKYTEKEINKEEFNSKYNDIMYDISYNNIVYSLINITCYILYFIVFAYIKKGQTLGKKLFKIRIKKIDDQTLTINDLIFRSLVNCSILYMIIDVALLMILKKNSYMMISQGLIFLQYGYYLINVIFVSFRNDGRGIHDLLAHTQVIKEEKK